MPDVGLVAAGHDDGGPIARPDVGQRQENVDLAAMKLAGVVAKLRADRPDVTPGVQMLGVARTADRAEAFVDKRESVLPVEVFGIVGTDEMHGFAEPAWVVDEGLPRRAGL